MVGGLVSIEIKQAEGGSVAYALWRSAVWVKCYAILEEVLNGQREIHTVEILIAELPLYGGN